MMWIVSAPRPMNHMGDALEKYTKTEDSRLNTGSPLFQIYSIFLQLPNVRRELVERTHENCSIVDSATPHEYRFFSYFSSKNFPRFRVSWVMTETPEIEINIWKQWEAENPCYKRIYNPFLPLNTQEERRRLALASFSRKIHYNMQMACAVQINRLL